MNHPMDNYIRDRMIADAAHVLELAKQQDSLEHHGLRGRFREILVDGLMEPWLPPTVACESGTVISFSNTLRSKTQEDILLIDRSISPSVLLKSQAVEGVFLRNSVLARIEVKSTLNNSGVNGFRESCEQFHTMNLDLDDERFKARSDHDKPIMELNFLVAFHSDLKDGSDLSRLMEVFSNDPPGAVSALCVADKGFWRVTKGIEGFAWQKYECQTGNHPAERLAAFVGLLSNSAFDQHIIFQGRERLYSLESGVGQYFNHWQPVL